jgi:hypothetical protein
MFLSQYFGLPLSISFHQRYMLIFILMLLLSEGQAGEDVGISQKAMLFRQSDSIE